MRPKARGWGISMKLNAVGRHGSLLRRSGVAIRGRHCIGKKKLKGLNFVLQYTT